MAKLGLYVGNLDFNLDDIYFVKLPFQKINRIFDLDNDLFECIVIDNCIQKLENFTNFLEEIKRILKPESQLIVSVPDYRLYEKCSWPSRYNDSHKHTFSLKMSRNLISRDNHWHIEENLLPELKKIGYDSFSTFLNDNNFDYDKPVLVDQTKEGASCYIVVNCVNKKEI